MTQAEKSTAFKINELGGLVRREWRAFIRKATITRWMAIMPTLAASPLGPFLLVGVALAPDHQASSPSNVRLLGSVLLAAAVLRLW